MYLQNSYRMNPLEPSGYFVYYWVYLSKIRTVFGMAPSTDGQYYCI